MQILFTPTPIERFAAIAADTPMPLPRAAISLMPGVISLLPPLFADGVDFATAAMVADADTRRALHADAAILQTFSSKSARCEYESSALSARGAVMRAARVLCHGVAGEARSVIYATTIRYAIYILLRHCSLLFTPLLLLLPPPLSLILRH